MLCMLLYAIVVFAVFLCCVIVVCYYVVLFLCCCVIMLCCDCCMLLCCVVFMLLCYYVVVLLLCVVMWLTFSLQKPERPIIGKPSNIFQSTGTAAMSDLFGDMSIEDTHLTSAPPTASSAPKGELNLSFVLCLEDREFNFVVFLC